LKQKKKDKSRKMNKHFRKLDKKVMKKNLIFGKRERERFVCAAEDE